MPYKGILADIQELEEILSVSENYQNYFFFYFTKRKN